MKKVSETMLRLLCSLDTLEADRGFLVQVEVSHRSQPRCGFRCDRRRDLSFDAYLTDLNRDHSGGPWTYQNSKLASWGRQGSDVKRISMQCVGETIFHSPWAPNDLSHFLKRRRRVIGEEKIRVHRYTIDVTRKVSSRTFCLQQFCTRGFESSGNTSTSGLLS